MLVLIKFYTNSIKWYINKFYTFCLDDLEAIQVGDLGVTILYNIKDLQIFGNISNT